MKNFIQRETMNFDGDDLEEYCRFLGGKFLATYAQVEGLQISASAKFLTRRSDENVGVCACQVLNVPRRASK